MKYIVIEIQTNIDGSIGFLTYDYADKAQAESKFHTVLSVAAVSALPAYAACLMDNTGRLLDRKCYEHQIDEETAIETAIEQ